jgi:AcrR family transcriptional regulator
MLAHNYPLDSPTEPRQARSKKRFNLILKTAARLFDEQGVVHITTNDIAAKADISVGSLYRYFPDKNAIIIALVQQYTAQIEAIFAEIENDPQLRNLSWQEVVYRLLQKWSAYLEKSKANTYTRFYRNNPAFGKLVHWQRQELWKKFIRIIQAKKPVTYPEKQLHMISATCLVSIIAALEAAQDMLRHKDKAKKNELLRECAIMVGDYLETFSV